MKIPVDLINYIIDFIDKNNLGQTDIFDNKPYTEIEKERLDKLLDICEDFLSGKITPSELSPSIEKNTSIPKNLSMEISQKILEYHPSNEKDKIENISMPKPIENKHEDKSIFSELIK